MKKILIIFILNSVFILAKQNLKFEIVAKENTNLHIIIKPSTKESKLKEIKYIVKTGDTLSGIAQKFKISLADLKKINLIENDGKIFIGQEILIKGAEKIA